MAAFAPVHPGPASTNARRASALVVHVKASEPTTLATRLAREGFVVATQDTWDGLPRTLAEVRPAIAIFVMTPMDKAPWAELVQRLGTCRVLVCGRPPAAAARELMRLDIIEFFDGPCAAAAVVGAVHRLMPTPGTGK